MAARGVVGGAEVCGPVVRALLRIVALEAVRAVFATCAQLFGRCATCGATVRNTSALGAFPGCVFMSVQSVCCATVRNVAHVA